MMRNSQGRDLTFRRRLHAGVAAVVLTLSLGVGTPAAARPAVAAEISGGVADFYRARGGRTLWLSLSAGNAAPQLIQLLTTARADNLNPKPYRVNDLTRAVQSASRGDPRAVQRAEMMLSAAYVTYARDMIRDPRVGIDYVDPELKPAPPAPIVLLQQAASAPSLSQYVGQLGWMNPIYASLRQALATGMYGNEHQRQLLAINLERARALPSGNGRYVIVNSAAQRLYMYDNGQVVDSMRLVVGRPNAPTPMMSAFIRYAALNPYWNSPADITSRRLAPNVVKQGYSYLKAKGYQVLSDWGESAHIVDPKTIDWKAVVAGKPIRMRQLPGPANSMGRMKFMFPNKEGIWLHDTPEKEVLEEASRLSSNGCIRLQDAPRLGRWLFGYALRPQGASAEQKVPLPNPVPLYITYLTAVPSGTSITYFDDFYGRDGTRMASR
jgi:murein L,D-transpeptidase YcbB/YkuD